MLSLGLNPPPLRPPRDTLIELPVIRPTGPHSNSVRGAYERVSGVFGLKWKWIPASAMSEADGVSEGCGFDLSAVVPEFGFSPCCGGLS